MEDDSKEKLIIGIYTCPKFTVRANGIRNTWLKLLPENIRVLFVFGRPGESPSLEGDCLFLDCEEAYEKLPYKSHAFYEYCYKNLDFDYILKIDDDTYLDLGQFLGFDKQGADYVGQFRDSPLKDRGKTWHYGKCTDKSYEVPDDAEFVCGWATGGGYFLSKKAVGILIKKTSVTHQNYIFEDRMVGEALTLHPDVKVMSTSFSEIGVINPLLPKDMLYIQNVLLEKQALLEKIKLLELENQRLKRLFADEKVERFDGAK